MVISKICAKIICVYELHALQSLRLNTWTAIKSTNSILLYKCKRLVFCNRGALSESSKFNSKYKNQNIHCIAHKRNDNSQSFALNGDPIVFSGTCVPILPSARGRLRYLLRSRRHRRPFCARAIRLEVGNAIYCKPAINRLSVAEGHGVCNSIHYPKQREVIT